MSLSNNIGLIMPYEESNENELAIMYTSNVIDPSCDLEQFRKTLRLDM